MLADGCLAGADRPQSSSPPPMLNLALNARAMRCRMAASSTLETSNVMLDEDYARINNEVTRRQLRDDRGQRYRHPAFRRDPATRCSSRSSPPRRSARAPGLGLSMVYGFVKQSSGHIKIYSEEGHGTSVKIYLPRATATAPDAAEALASADNVEGGRETMLVVEDDPLVRNYVDRRRSRASATRTLDGRQRRRGAATCIDNAPTSICCSPTSSCPGRMNGRQLGRRGVEAAPSPKTLFTLRLYRERDRSPRPARSGVLLLRPQAVSP